MIAVENKCYLEWKIYFALNIKSIESRSQFFESSLHKALIAMFFLEGEGFLVVFVLGRWLGNYCSASPKLKIDSGSHSNVML